MMGVYLLAKLPDCVQSVDGLPTTVTSSMSTAMSARVAHLPWCSPTLSGDWGGISTTPQNTSPAAAAVRPPSRRLYGQAETVLRLEDSTSVRPLLPSALARTTIQWASVLVLNDSSPLNASSPFLFPFGPHSHIAALLDFNMDDVRSAADRTILDVLLASRADWPTAITISSPQASQT